MDQVLLALLPIVAYFAIFLYLGNLISFTRVKQLLLRSAIFWGCYLVLIMEGLSPLHWITRAGLIVSWLIPILGFAGWAYHRARCGVTLHFPRIGLPRSWDAWLIAVLSLGILGTTFLVAWFAPPQTQDSLTYHLARVAHWAQNASIWHYASGIERQISMTPGAELITLNNYVLIQSDRLASLTQWMAMLGSMIGIALITARLGARSHGQWLAVICALALPIGLMESSSTINDYVATFWTVCAAAEVMDYTLNGEKASLFYMAAAAGLALNTKPTVVPYLAFFGIWAVYQLLRRMKWREMIQWGALAVGMVVIINAGYLARNLITYGTFIDPVDVKLQANTLHTPLALFSNLLKYMGVHAGFPHADAWNHWVYLTIAKIHYKIGIKPEDPRLTQAGYFMVQSPNTGDDYGTNPFHAALFLLCSAALLIYWVCKRQGGLALLYAGMVAAGFVGFCYIYKWQSFSLRLETVFFVLFCPIAGYTLGLLETIILIKGQAKIVGVLVAAGLVYTSLPWLLKIDTRPLIPTNRNPSVPSVLTTPREQLYYGVMPGYAAIIRAVTDPILQQGCNQVGMMILGDDPEYYFWVELGAPRNDLRIEWIVAGTPSAKYRLADFKPCAVIASGWKDPSILGLHLYLRSGSYQLFLNPK